MEENIPSVAVDSSPKADSTFHSSHAAFVDNFGGFCTLLSCGIAGYQILQHFQYYTQPQIQLQIIRILSMIPVYSGATLLSIVHPEWTLVCNTIRDIYEAYVLYIFMQLLVQFLGGENSLIVHLEFKRRIKQPWPLDRLRPLQTDKIFFRRVKQGVLQFVLIKPITSVLSIILDKYDMFCDGTYNLHCGFPWLAFVNNISVSLSLYFLVLFYKATEERLAPFNPFYKFVTVKAILFFSFWQSCLFQILTTFEMFSRDTGNVVLNLIISVEMVFVALGQSYAFTYTDFADACSFEAPKSGAFAVKSSSRKEQGICDAIGQVLFSTRDVIEDAHSTFIKDMEEEQDRQLQLDELKKAKNSAFNWSDEELLGDMDDLTDVVYKDKYIKRKKTNNSAISQLKQSVKRGISQAKAGMKRGDVNQDPLGGQKTQVVQPSWAKKNDSEERIIEEETKKGSLDDSDTGLMASSADEEARGGAQSYYQPENAGNGSGVQDAQQAQ